MFYDNNIVSACLGKKKRLHRLFNNEKCVFVPLDDSLISGPTLGLSNLKSKVEEICQANPSAILGFSGSLRLINKVDYNIPYILNLTASTNRSEHTNKALIYSVEQAVAMGADAVAVHINISSKYEKQMLNSLGIVSENCDKFGMPLMVLAYPRKEICSDGVWISDDNYNEIKSVNPDEYASIVAHCVRVAYEMGADIIKTQYTGTKSSFEKVIESAQRIPVIIAGGDMTNDKELFSMCRDAIDAGGSGICIGRNVFNRNNSQKILTILKEIVFNGISAEDAVEYIKK